MLNTGETLNKIKYDKDYLRLKRGRISRMKERENGR
jgi:hypothetical protein